MVGFVALFLFAVTGLTLNHADYFERNGGTVREEGGTLDTAWMTDDDERIDRLSIVEALRSTHQIRGAVHDFVVATDELVIVFKGPGYSADAFIERSTGDYTTSEEARGFVAVLDDLHKGRDSGAAWSWVVDVSAVLMALAALWTAVAGGAIPLVVVYLLWVP